MQNIVRLGFDLLQDSLGGLFWIPCKEELVWTHADVYERLHLHLRLVVEYHFLLYFLPVENVVNVAHLDEKFLHNHSQAHFLSHQS